MDREALLRSYIPIADYIAAINGPHCEAVIHDLRDLDHSLYYITSPSLTNRPLGSGLTEYARRLLENRTDLHQNYVVNYTGASLDPGRVFRSSTFFIRDGGEPVGLLCVNVDVSALLQARTALEDAIGLEAAQLGGTSEIFASSPDELIEAAVKEVLSGEKSGRLTVSGKRTAARRLKQQGLFQVRGTLTAFAKRIGVSEQTVYRYIRD